MTVWRTLPAVLISLALSLMMISCTSSPQGESGQDIDSIAGPFEFSVPRWEFKTLKGRLWESLKPATDRDTGDVEAVRAYFASVAEGTADPQLEDQAEHILSRQIREALINEGIMNPLDSFLPLRIVFPPIDFEFENPPNLLVVSPRDEIRLMKRRTLEPGLSIEEKENIESQVDALGYSSLVVGLGGVGFTFPTMVVSSSNIRWTIDTAVEEWFHQYMFFHPLGFMYALDGLDWQPEPDIVTMNETVAGIVSKEIGARVYDDYYAAEGAEPSPPRDEPSEFDLIMRDIRLHVDELLAQGKVADAEEYMKEQKDYLHSIGYRHLRKLNQAYFAFHGSYADEPTTPSPIGQDLQLLRRRSASLADFLNKVKTMRSYDDLKQALEDSGP